VKFLDQFDVFIFDLDGLLIDSLDKLSNALVQSVSKFANSSQLINFQKYDKQNPGLSRFEKVDFFINSILKNYDLKPEIILKTFDELSLEARINSTLNPCINELYYIYESKHWILLTNCDNQQLTHVANKFDLARIFGNNLIGTPPSKGSRAKEIRIKNQGRSIISISDSESDGKLAEINEFDFLFVEEFSRGNSDWKINNYFSIQRLDDLLDLSLKVKLVK
jgi:phosphoglycolate phosphatase-like HAD superfamily hydrolase